MIPRRTPDAIPPSANPLALNHDESERQTCLANNDPMKQAHHFFAWPEESLGFSKNIFQQDAIKEPSPKENKDERGDEREDESFHELLYS
jgi:hypothetical protein